MAYDLVIMHRDPPQGLKPTSPEGTNVEFEIDSQGIVVEDMVDDIQWVMDTTTSPSRAVSPLLPTLDSIIEDGLLDQQLPAAGDDVYTPLLQKTNLCTLRMSLFM
jgi:hypothetical protein